MTVTAATSRRLGDARQRADPDYQGAIVRHTAARSSAQRPEPSRRVVIDGRPGLRGPLCNSLGGFDGSVRIIAAHPANHAGASGGRSMGPLPVTRAFNRLVRGTRSTTPAPFR